MVLLVLSVMAAVAVPSLLETPRDDDMTAATRRIEGLFRLARDSAARSGSRVSVVIDSATSRVWLDAQNTFATPAQAGTSTTGGEDLELPNGVRLELTKTRATFAFAPSGVAFADSLLLVSSLGSRVVSIHPWTGDVRVR
jgi:Tfp pilus assembly protein FimT